MPFTVVIPARYGSTRLPGKPLVKIGDKPMIQWVVDAACASSAESVWVATDDERIASQIRNPRGSESIAVMTSVDHASGTDRIAELARRFNWSCDTIIVNVQGDEPQMPAEVIDQVAALLLADPAAAMATLSTPITHLDEFLDPNVVKVVTDGSGAALYFSRAPIPWDRDAASTSGGAQTRFTHARRHLGIYAYRVSALLRITELPQSPLEKLEKLEQLRAMEAGLRIRVAVAKRLPGMGIDTPADLERLRQSS